MKTTYLFLISIVLLTSACNKKPVASFTTDKDSYMQNETVTLSNTSTNASTFAWQVTGANYDFRSSDADISFPASNVGSYEIVLLSYSKNNQKMDKVSQTINVTSFTGNGSYVFYSSFIYSSFIRIYVDNVYKGNITQQYNASSVTCNTVGCLTLSLPVGNHTIAAYLNGSSGNNSTTYINVTNNSCNKIEISV